LPWLVDGKRATLTERAYVVLRSAQTQIFGMTSCRNIAVSGPLGGTVKALQIKRCSIYQGGKESALFGPVCLEVRVIDSGFV